jgi:tetratricopeptide (TPR) repeat protein
MLKSFIAAVSLVMLCSSLYANIDSLFSVLDQELTKKSYYTEQRLKTIEGLKRKLKNPTSESERYGLYNQIFEEYKGINFDSAFTYANIIQEQALLSRESAKIEGAKLNQAFILLSAGMFKETQEIVDDIDVSQLTEDNVVHYYILKSRYYYDLCDFVGNETYCGKYVTLGHQFADSAIHLAPEESYAYYFISGLKNLRMGKPDEAIADYSVLINDHQLTDNQYAIIASSLSYLYDWKNQQDKSLELLIKAAIADIKSAMKENTAMFRLADISFKVGDNKRAYQYIREAMADAEFYNARQRQFAVGNLLPVIGSKQLALVEQQRSVIFKYATAVTLLVLIIVLFIVVVIRQNRKLKTAQTSLTSMNETLKEINVELTDVNKAIREANKIKDEYIGYYFNVNSEYIGKIEHFKKSLSQRLTARMYDSIEQMVDRIDLKKEREDLAVGFDKVFIKLFPNFVTKFNELFADKDKIVLAEGQILNPELRIFALIRLGIQDNDKIAKILNFSVNTIYAYKTRIKNKSLVPKEEFERKIMEIEGET